MRQSQYVAHAHLHFKRLLTRPAELTMLLSLVQVKLTLTGHFNGFINGHISDQHPLDGPLIMRSSTGHCDIIHPDIYCILQDLLRTNPYVRSFVTLLETPHKGFPVIETDAFRDFIGNQSDRDPNCVDRDTQHALLSYIGALVAARPLVAPETTQDTFQLVGQVQQRTQNGHGSKNVLIVDYEGLPYQ